MDATLREVLRHRTHADHVRLNRHRLLAGLTKAGYALAAYQLLLAAYYHFYRDLEAAIDRFMSGRHFGFDYGQRRKHPWLVEDLQYFGLQPESEALAPRQALGIGPITTNEELVGVLYAIEGATLGGQVISSHIASTLGLREGRGASFFVGYGAKTGIYWQQFEMFAASLCVTAEQKHAAGEAARQVFNLVEHLLDDYAARLDS
ncbi:MAG: hypothetical protein EG825_07560 [Rhodocyclaceae bacterium]|nr:hypothetical protein [Rhodocyclaceae bacterium]